MRKFYWRMSQENNLNLLYLLAVVRKYLWYIVGVVVFSGLLAVVFTMPTFYPPEYMSSTVIYPTNAERFDGIGLFAEEPAIFLYGDAKGVERLKNIASSEEVMLKVLDNFDLWTAYGVNKETDESPKFYAARSYNANISTVKIGGNGLEITAYDTDPQRAANIVNFIAHTVDAINKRMINENRTPILEIYRKSLDQSFRQVALYADSASRIRSEYNIFNDQAQTEVLLEQVLTAESELAANQTRLKAMERAHGANSAQANAARLERDMQQSRARALINKSSGTEVNLQKFQEGLDKTAAIGDVSLRLARDIKDLQSKMGYLEMMEKTDYSTILTIEQATPSDRKARPIRWIILALTLIITGAASLVGAVLIDFFTREKGEENREKRKEEKGDKLRNE